MQQYIRSVEWSLSRLPASSLKYNVELGTSFERWLAIMATFVSLCISSLFISVLTNIMAGVARRTRKMTLILESVRKYCASSGVSLTHTMKIRRLVEREHFRANLQDHMQFLLSLPESLVRELFHEARSLTLNCHPFFLEIGLANATMELNLCNQAVKELYLLENDCMFHANQKGQGLYILASGAAIYAPGSEFHHPNPIEIASSPVQAPSSGSCSQNFKGCVISFFSFFSMVVFCLGFFCSYWLRAVKTERNPIFQHSKLAIKSTPRTRFLQQSPQHLRKPWRRRCCTKDDDSWFTCQTRGRTERKP